MPRPEITFGRLEWFELAMLQMWKAMEKGLPWAPET
jgi:hypothetical protein